jgi:hypothetical protein
MSVIWKIARNYSQLGMPRDFILGFVEFGLSLWPTIYSKIER